MVRSVAREAVYRMLKEMKECPAEEDSVPVVEAFEVQSIGLVDRTGKKLTLGGGRSRRRRLRRGRGAMCFDCSSLYKDSAEALNDFKFRQEDDEDASYYVQVVFPERSPPDHPLNVV
ncbi:hypothetical protein PInf_023393 [Phytophthora infestans]|nr:hypothetical protein PInf_023393 [Phytophthora infestans]